VTEEEEEIDVQYVINELKTLKEERSSIEKKMNDYLKELGYQV
jgi:type I restriction-modification system DNA methylase subunit